MKPLKWVPMLAACGDAPATPPFDLLFSHTVTSRGFNNQSGRYERRFRLTAAASGGAIGAYAE